MLLRSYKSVRIWNIENSAIEPKSPSKLYLSIMGFSHYKWILKICGVCLVILLLLLGVYFASNKAGKAVVKSGFYHYTVVVDCGSTGTRVNVYKWWKPASLSDWDLPILLHSYPDNSTQSLSRGSSCKYHCVQTEPGLDKFVGNSTGVRLSLEPLILWAEQWVPRERHGDTPIFVLATAGLRRLLLEDARQVLDAVEDVVKEHSFVYKKSWIRVLSGKEEAYYGWVALNYKMGSLGNSSMGPTLGLLDLGGSSLQVVMEVHGGGRNDANLIRSKIGLVEHYILAFSLSSFGLNEAFDRTVAMLSQVQPGGGGNNERYEVRHPCLGFGFQRNYTCYVCDGINVPYQKNLSIQTHKSEFTNTHLVGDPDWEICKGIARAAALNLSSLDWSQPTDLNNCKTGLSSYGKFKTLFQFPLFVV
jgi:apyrase